MTDYTVNDIIDYSAAGQPLKVADAFNHVMQQKVQDRIADFESAIRPGMFGAEESELEDADLDDIDIDDDDLDLDDDSDWDEDDVDDLDFDDEDLDLDDEDFSDEDA